MVDLKQEDVNQSAPILDEEDEATLAAIDWGIQSADEGRVVAPGRSSRANEPVAYKILFTEDSLSEPEVVLDYISAEVEARQPASTTGDLTMAFGKAR